MRRLVAAVLVGGLLAAGCGTGTPVTQTRQVDGFDRLRVQGSLDLEIALSNRPDPGVTVTAGSKTIDRIRTEVRDGTLHIDTESEGLVIGPNPVGDVNISLGVPALAAVEVDGSTNLRLSGISAKSLELRMSGDGQLRVLGRADQINVEFDGSVNADLSRLAAKEAQVRIDGSGQTALRVSDSLDLVLEGSADVTYIGRPRVSSRIDGSGNVRQIDE